jgi:hypothetical protein
VCGAPINNATDDDLSKQQSCAVCGSTRRNIVVTPGSISINLSPFAFQWYAKDFYEAYKAYKKLKNVAKFSPALLTLLAQAIELAAKSMHEIKARMTTNCAQSHTTSSKHATRLSLVSTGLPLLRMKQPNSRS